MTQVEVGDTAFPLRNYGNCMQYGQGYPVISVKDCPTNGRSFFINCPCDGVKCKEVGWWPIESDFRIVTGPRVSTEEAQRIPPLPSPDDAAKFFKRD